MQTTEETPYSGGSLKPWLLSSRNLRYPRAEIYGAYLVPGTRKEMSPSRVSESFILSMDFGWWLKFDLILFYFF